MNTWRSSSWTERRKDGEPPMAMIEINKNPSRKELLWFGLLFLLFFGIIGALAYWKFQAPQVAYWIWGVAAVVASIFFIFPPFRRPLYLGWVYAAYPIGLVVSYLVMVAIYYLVVTPIGLVMRLAGRDSLNRRFDAEARTYWSAHERSDQARYFRQF
jgi:hypothetical protein